VSFLTAPEWTPSCQSSGLAGILPFATHPPLSRFRVNGSHSAGWAAFILYRQTISSILPFATHPPLSRFRVNGSHQRGLGGPNNVHSDWGGSILVLPTWRVICPSFLGWQNPTTVWITSANVKLFPLMLALGNSS